MNVENLINKLQQKQVKSFNKNGIHIEEQIQLTSHLWNVSSLAFSPNGLYLASASWDKTAHIWDLRTLEKPLKLQNGHSEPLTCVAWLPQLEFLLATSSSDQSVIIWNADTGDIMSRLSEHRSWVLDLSFEESGQYLASASWDKTVIIWDMNVLKPVEILRGHNEGVHSCQFDKNTSNPLLCTTSEETSIRLWDKRSDNRWHSDIILSGIHNGGVKCCNWSPCSNYIAAGSTDSKISVWDLRAVKVINCLYGHKSDVRQVEFMPTSSSLLFSVGDASCKFWNPFSPQGESLLTLQQHAWSYEVESMCLSPDATLLATGGVDRAVCLSSVEVSEELTTNLRADINSLPYAKIPAITQTIPQANLQGGSSAKFVDSAVYRYEEREKEINKKIAKQTIRINVPATSELLQHKLTNLRNVQGDVNNNDTRSFQDEVKMRRNTKPSNERMKTSRDIIVQHKKNAPPPVKLKPSNRSTTKSDSNANSVIDELSTRFRLASHDSSDSTDDVFVTPRDQKQTSDYRKKSTSNGVFSI